MCLQGCCILDKSGGVACLEGLEYHSNPTIAAKANDLLETYCLINAEEVNTLEL